MNPDIDLRDMACTRRPWKTEEGTQERDEERQDAAKANAGATESELETGHQKE